MRRTLRLSLAVATLALLGAVFASTAGASKYIVLYEQEATPLDAASSMLIAGGTLVASYPQIGVVIAESDSPTFREQLLRDQRVEGATATSGFGVQIDVQQHGDDDYAPELPNAPAADADTFSSLQWDMRQIEAPAAHAITGGSPTIVVGDIDTGLDKDHPDLIANIDFAKSASCETGAPVQNPVAWDDHAGHGTHTAGTIAAASNGIGVVGVAPNVKVAGIKSSNNAGFFFPEMVVCSFMWASTQHLDVTNNSYFADPYLFNCHNDPDQQAIWKAEYRAIRYAMSQGVTVVASAGNENVDLAHPPADADSTQPDQGIGNNCLVIPAEVPGVITVTAVGDREQKSYYSSYGIGKVEVTAPGGDGVFQLTPEAPNGQVLSTWPAELGGSRRMIDPGGPNYPSSVYRYLQGTSMSSPHAAGVAALIVSRFGDARNPQNGHMRPGAVEQYLNSTADPIPCPPNPFDPAIGSTRPELAGRFVASCQGGPTYNSFYGHGEVNALRAVLHDTQDR